jgi:predicted chitinase
MAGESIFIVPELLERMGARINDVDAHCATLSREAAIYDIDTRTRLAHFLGQLFHESGYLRHTVENLNYSTEGLLKTFRKYFTPDLARTYARQPERIANRVYALRMGNGDERSCDGWKFRGRGLVQVTGKDNYRALGKWLGVDLLSNPDRVATEYAAHSAVWFWTVNNLNRWADTDDVTLVTKIINGGTNGLADRIALTNRAKVEIEKVYK